MRMGFSSSSVLGTSVLLVGSLHFTIKQLEEVDKLDPAISRFSGNMNLTPKEESSPTQVMGCKVSVVRVVVQRMAQKSWGVLCRLLCCPSDSQTHEEATCFTGHTIESAKEKVMHVPSWSPPSTIYIVNISNSNLTHCVIGKDAYPSTVAEQQPLMQETGLLTGEPRRCSCRHGQQGAAQAPPPPPPPPPPPLLLPPSAESQHINIHDSSLSCVIIGSNNNMEVENPEMLA